MLLIYWQSRYMYAAFYAVFHLLQAGWYILLFDYLTLLCVLRSVFFSSELLVDSDNIRVGKMRSRQQKKIREGHDHRSPSPALSYAS